MILYKWCRFSIGYRMTRYGTLSHTVLTFSLRAQIEIRRPSLIYRDASNELLNAQNSHRFTLKWWVPWKVLEIIYKRGIKRMTHSCKFYFIFFRTLSIAFLAHNTTHETCIKVLVYGWCQAIFQQIKISECFDCAFQIFYIFFGSVCYRHR